MFFNMNDPAIAQTNVPQKQDSSMHLAVLVGSVFLFAGVIVVGIGANNFLTGVAIGLIVGFAYLIYIISTICCSDIRGYITNLKKFDEYAETYDSMVKGKGFFRFWI